MDMGSIKKIAALFAGILLAFLVANALSNLVLNLTGLTGAAGMILNIIVYAVIFFFVLSLLERYAHITFFGFDRH